MIAKTEMQQKFVVLKKTEKKSTKKTTKIFEPSRKQKTSSEF